MTNGTTVAMSKKSKFRIFIDKGVVVIEDEDLTRGGNLLTNGGKWVSWRNDTGGTCRLVFRELLDADGSGQGKIAWPFDPNQNPPSTQLVIQKNQQTGKNPWRGKFKGVGVGDLACFEYKVHVEMDDGSSYELDPVIIVRP